MKRDVPTHFVSKKCVADVDLRSNQSSFLRSETEKPLLKGLFCAHIAYHLGEGRVLKTFPDITEFSSLAYHLGEGRVLKTALRSSADQDQAYHLGEGRVLKT